MVYYFSGERFSQKIGPLPYMSPQMLNESYGEETELWNLGIVVFTLLTGSEPIFGSSEEEIKQGIQRATFLKTESWVSISEEGKSLVLGLLCPDENRRLKPEEVLGKVQYFMKKSPAL